MYDPQVDALGLSSWIPGRPYPEPTFVGRVPLAHYDAAYHIQNWGMRSTQLIRYEAPAYTFKSNQLYPIKRAAAPNTGTQQGRAPAQGIYTGTPASGCTGGGPYS